MGWKKLSLPIAPAILTILSFVMFCSKNCNQSKDLSKRLSLVPKNKLHKKMGLKSTCDQKIWANMDFKKIPAVSHFVQLWKMKASGNENKISKIVREVSETWWRHTYIQKDIFFLLFWKILAIAKPSFMNGKKYCKTYHTKALAKMLKKNTAKRKSRINFIILFIH